MSYPSLLKLASGDSELLMYYSFRIGVSLVKNIATRLREEPVGNAATQCVLTTQHNNMDAILRMWHHSFSQLCG